MFNLVHHHHHHHYHHTHTHTDAHTHKFTRRKMINKEEEYEEEKQEVNEGGEEGYGGYVSTQKVGQDGSRDNTIYNSLQIQQTL